MRDRIKTFTLRMSEKQILTTTLV